VGRVEWVDHPFAQGGDSGSLVWATVKGRKVPVGIHKGSGDEESFFMLLQPIFDLIEEIHDEDLSFVRVRVIFFYHRCGVSRIRPTRLTFPHGVY
jgi:hypothetical protein